MQTKYFSHKSRWTIITSAGLLLLLAGSLQPNDAQDSQNNASLNYSFQVSLPPSAVRQNDRLSLPNLPLYDRNNRYLQTRDSSLDWYDISLLDEQTQRPTATNQILNEQKQQGKASRLLDANKRILPATTNILLDETLVPIPAQ